MGNFETLVSLIEKIKLQYYYLLYENLIGNFETSLFLIDEQFVWFIFQINQQLQKRLLGKRDVIERTLEELSFIKKFTKKLKSYEKIRNFLKLKYKRNC